MHETALYPPFKWFTGKNQIKSFLNCGIPCNDFKKHTWCNWAFRNSESVSKHSNRMAYCESFDSDQDIWIRLFDFMRRRKNRLPPDKSNAFWLEHLSDFDRRCSRLTITCVIKVPREQNETSRRGQTLEVFSGPKITSYPNLTCINNNKKDKPDPRQTRWN